MARPSEMKETQRMTHLSRAEIEDRKRAVYEAMSPRRKRYIEKIGYDKWDPFQEPNDPIDIRTDATKRTTKQLIREFLQTQIGDEYSNNYGQGAFDMALGIINKDERILGMYDFACWYQELLKREKK